MRRFAPDWRNVPLPGPHVVRDIATIILNEAKGDTREALLRACSMWYPPEFIAAVQRHITRWNLMEIVFAEKCAWRAVYIYRRRGGPQLFAIGLDPTAGPGPRAFVGVRGRFVHFTMPHITWTLASRRRWLLPLYRLQQRTLHRIDGRFRAA